MKFMAIILLPWWLKFCSPEGVECNELSVYGVSLDITNVMQKAFTKMKWHSVPCATNLMVVLKCVFFVLFQFCTFRGRVKQQILKDSYKHLCKYMNGECLLQEQQISLFFFSIVPLYNVSFVYSFCIVCLN